MPVKIQETLDQIARLRDQARDVPLKEQLAKTHQEVTTFLQEQDVERNKLLTTINQNQATIVELQSAVAARQKENAEQVRTIADLQKRLETVSKVSTATPLDLANSFKGVVDAIQAEARKAAGVGTTIKSMELEVKGLVQVQANNVTTLVLPNVGTAIEAGALSTLRVSFGSIPVVAPQAADKPASPGSTPGTPPRPPNT